jgi:hypothetical protein
MEIDLEKMNELQNDATVQNMMENDKVNTNNISELLGNGLEMGLEVAQVAVNVASSLEVGEMIGDLFSGVGDLFSGVGDLFS